MPTELAPNRQAEQSLEVMEVELPSDLPLAAVQSPAVATLCRLEGGCVLLDLNDHLREAVMASFNLNKAAEVNLKIKMKPGGQGRMELVASVSSKIPKEVRTSTSLFMSHDGQLTAHDPNQRRLDLRVVKSTPVATKIIDVQAKPARNVLNPNETEQEQE